MIEQVRNDVNALLTDFFDQKITQAYAVSNDYARLWEVMHRLNQAGGKRLRPYMVLLSYQACGGDQSKLVLSVAAAWELLHMSMLIHDDIIDNDLIRYGINNVAGSYNELYAAADVLPERRQHYATSAALLAGDLVLSGAHQMVLSSGLSDSQKLISSQALTDATFTVVGGELLDTEAAMLSMDAADPLLIAHLKTASYSFVGPLTNGAQLAGADAATVAALEQYGLAVGRAFQLVDDVIGIFGDSSQTGKTNTGDLSEGKRTYIMQQTFLMASADDRIVLERLVGKPDLQPDEADRLRAIITASGARAQTEKIIQQLVMQATAVVDNLPFSEAYRQEFKTLITLVSQRQF